jgi:aspartyl protease family protein
VLETRVMGSAGIFATGRIMRQLLFVAGLFVALGVVFASYMDRSLRTSPAQETTAMAVAPAPAAAGRTVVIPRDSRGHFQVNGRVDGKNIGFMVDTGASLIALTAHDAARLGIRPAVRDFTAEVKTANGRVRAARVQLDRVEIDDVTVRNVAALIVPDEALSENLLGLSFLSKLRRFEYANGKLVLEQ